MKNNINLYLLLKSLFRFFLSFFLYLFFFLVFIIIILIRPLFFFRFGRVRNDVLGNSLFDLELYLSKKQLNKNYRYIDIFHTTVYPKYFPNDYLKIYTYKSINVLYFSKYIYNIILFLPFFKYHIVNMLGHKTTDMDTEGVYFLTKSNLIFSNIQNQNSINFLKKKGLKDNQKYICLIIRDSFYKNNYQKHIKSDWSYHDYRNSDLSTYNKTVLELIRLGYFVIRMGKGAKTKFPIINKNFYDYSFDEDRNDFLDFWITFNCFFCVTTGTGLDEIVYMARKPVVEVNYLPCGTLRSERYTHSLFKKLRFKNSLKYLGIKELIKHDLLFSFDNKKVSDLNIEIIDNNADEILDTVIEMEQKINGIWKNTQKNKFNQSLFWDKIKEDNKFKIYHNFKHPNSSISSNFLKNNSDWFLN